MHERIHCHIMFRLFFNRGIMPTEHRLGTSPYLTAVTMYVHVYAVGTWLSVLIREVSLIQGCPLEGVSLYTVHTYSVCTLYMYMYIHVSWSLLWLFSYEMERGARGEGRGERYSEGSSVIYSNLNTSFSLFSPSEAKDAHVSPESSLTLS